MRIGRGWILWALEFYLLLASSCPVMGSCPIQSAGSNMPDDKIFLDQTKSTWSVWAVYNANVVGSASSSQVDRIQDSYCPWFDYINNNTTSDPVYINVGWWLEGPPPPDEPAAIFVPFSTIASVCPGTDNVACSPQTIFYDFAVDHEIVINWTTFFPEDYKDVPGAPAGRYFRYSFEFYPGGDSNFSQILVHFLSLATHEAGHDFGAAHAATSCPSGCNTAAALPTMIPDASHYDGTCFNGGLFEGNYLLFDLSDSDRSWLVDHYNGRTSGKPLPASSPNIVCSSRLDVTLDVIRVKLTGQRLEVTADCRGRGLGVYLFGSDTRAGDKIMLSESLVYSLDIAGSCVYGVDVRTGLDLKYVWIQVQDSDTVIGPFTVEGEREISGNLVAYPNPCILPGSVQLSIESGLGPVESIMIFDICGKAVWFKELTENRATWSGLNKEGTGVATGIYVARAIGKEGKVLAEQRFLVLRK